MPSLFRYMSLENAEALVRRGEILFRALSYFRDYEDDGVRADEKEGTLVHLPKDGLKLRLKATGNEITVPYTLESTAQEDDIFVYCLSTELNESIAARFKAKSCVEIIEPLHFVHHLRSALSRRSRIKDKHLVHGPVTYYEKHDPPIVDWALPERIAFRKPQAFRWQSEYRFSFGVNNSFAVENVDVKLVPLGSRVQRRALSHPHMLLKVGSIQKICRIHRF